MSVQKSANLKFVWSTQTGRWDHDEIYCLVSMKLGKCLNTTPEEVEKGLFNIFYGFSLGNRYFTQERIQAYLLWGLEHTKNKLAVLIPDKIHAVNYEVKSGYTAARAMKVALRKGEEVEATVRAALTAMGLSEAPILLLHWKDIEDTQYLKNHKVILEAFAKNPDFRQTIVNLVKEAPQFEDFDFEEVQYERLSQYILDELPILIGGFVVNGSRFDLLPYPGFANLDYLALDLQEGKRFPEITKQLQFEEKLRLVELYVE
jgi:tRNA-dependent cyclodipeptide synthase